MQGWYTVEIFCLMPKMLHSSLVNRKAKQGSLSRIILEGSLCEGNICLAYKATVSLALISSRQGIKRDILVQSWSVMVRMESKPCDSGSFVIKFNAIVSNGSASGVG